MSIDAVVFWSYVRDDDTAEDGRIVRLSRQLRAEYELLTGESLFLFVDREGVEWGDQWRARVDEALAGTTFFVPIVTPRFLSSTECRRELLTFAGTARSLDLEELILPIYYVPVPAIESEQPTRDEAVDLVAERQWEDWREVRLEDHTSARYRQSVNKLAVRLAQVATRVRERPDIQPLPPGVGPRGEAEGETGEEPEGVVDLLARGEDALPKLVPLLESAGAVVKSVGRSMEQATQRLQESDRRGRGFSGRLAVSRQLAQELNEPAENLAGFGEDYASLIVDIDPAILTLIRLVDADPSQYREAEQVREMFQSIKEMVGAARDAADSTEQLVSGLEAIAGYSRDLRRPIRRLQAGLRSFSDGKSLFEEWGRLIDKFESEHGTSRE